MPAPRASEVLVVGDRLSAPLLGHALREQGVGARLLSLDSTRRGRELGAIGNGEYYANARRLYGVPLAEKLWDFSARNFLRAQEVLRELGIPARPVRQAWYAANERERDLQRETAELLKSNAVQPSDLPAFLCRLEEPALSWEAAALEKAVPAEPIDALIAVEREGALDVGVRFRRAGREERARVAVAIFASEEIPRAVFPWLGDKSIPVTLSSFLFPQRKPLPFARAIFNGGADFAIAEAGALRLGSYRNLHNDRAVGRLSEADPATLTGVRGFFGGLGWIDAAVEPEARLDYEALSCDGLPVIGALPELPGAWVLTGWAARGTAFVFEAARQLAAGLARGGDFAGLQPFSTKRFV